MRRTLLPLLRQAFISLINTPIKCVTHKDTVMTVRASPLFRLTIEVITRKDKENLRHELEQIQSSYA